MATRAAKKGTTEQPDPPEPGDDEVSLSADQGDEGGEDDALAELRGIGAGGDYRYTVSRVSAEPGKKAGYCKTYTVGDLSLDGIREEFGGGKYKIRVIDAAGKYKAQTTVDIVDLPKPAAAAPAAPVAAGPDLSGIAAILSAVKPGEGGGLSQILTMMMAQQSETTKMIVALMQRPQETTKLTDILALINASKDNAPKSDGVDTLLKGIELGKTLAGGGGDGDDMLGIAGKGLDLLAPLIKREAAAPAQPAAAVPVVRRLPAPSPDVAPGRPVQPAQPVQPVQHEESAAAVEGGDVSIIQQIQWIKKQLAVLVVQASRQKDPELYAEVMLDNLPPFITAEDINQHIGAENALDKLATLDPRVTQFRPWFEEFRTAVINFLADTGEDDEPEAPDPGDLSHLDNPQEDVL